ncbi:hypothetical protein D3C85_919840 [compost metagenome]
MKVKLTPLNIVSAVFLVIAVMLMFEKQPAPGVKTIDLARILMWFSFLIVLVSFISDQIFRKFIPELKKIWAIECAFIVFTIILVFIIKVSIY